MRILSSFKDYYDFPPFGYDTNDALVYERKAEEIAMDNNYHLQQGRIYVHEKDMEEAKDYIVSGRRQYTDMERYYLFICDRCFILYMPWQKILEGYEHNRAQLYRPVKCLTTLNGLPETKKRWNTTKYTDFDNIEITTEIPKLNSILDCPVLLAKPHNSGMTVYKNVSLRDLGFDVMTVEQVYQEIEMFLGRKKDIVVNTLSDKERETAKGFDVEKSFRN